MGNIFRNNSWRARLDSLNLSAEEKQKVRDCIIEGSIKPDGWDAFNNEELARSLRTIIRRGKINYLFSFRQMQGVFQIITFNICIFFLELFFN